MLKVKMKALTSVNSDSLKVHFTVAFLFAMSFHRSEARGDLVMIQILLLFKFKLLCFHVN